MNKNIKDRADRVIRDIYLDGFEHGFKEALPIATKSCITVLEAIKAEIESHICGCGLYNDGLYMSIKIIDKYIGEGSDKE